MAKRKKCSDVRSNKPLALDNSEWPIELGKLMKTPTFRPTEEEFADFYAYAQKLDRLVGHVGVCKVIPPQGWQPRAHDVYNLKDSMEELEEAVTVKKPIKQNAIGGKGLYLNLHEEKRSMTLKAFKKATQEKPFQPPVDPTSDSVSDEDLELLERRFWKNVLFSPPMYGADCPAPQGFRKDGREGLFDPEVCGSWDLAKLPSLLNFGLKKKVPGVNTSFIYVGMYRAAFAWHCEDMDLHSINYLHWGAPKTWYTVPATHGKKLEELARKHFPVQARECSEFLRHKTNIIEPNILLKAGIPLTRTVQKAGEFIINFPGAYHSGFNNGYNCAESCNFATEYWIPFGVQAKPCSCASKQNSVRIDVDAILNKVKDVKVKGEQWVQCEACSKWRLLPPYMMHLLSDDDPFTCNLIEGMTCGKKEQKDAWAGEDGQWEVDGKVQLGLDPDKEQWVLCEQCKKWRRIPEGVSLDADAVFVCSVLEGWNCEKEEEKWEDAEDGQGWQIMDVDERRSKYGEWTAADEEKLRIKFIKEELAAYHVGEQRIAECGDDRARLEALLEKTASEVAASWEELGGRWPSLAPAERGAGSGNLVGSPARMAAAAVAQRLWFMDVEAEEGRELSRKRKEQEKRKRKMEELRAEEARAVQEYTEEIHGRLRALLHASPSGHHAGHMSPSRASSPMVSRCASPIPRCSSPIPRAGSPMCHSAKRMRFHRQTVSIICFGSGVVDRGLCKDDKAWMQLQRLLTPSSRDSSTIHLPGARLGSEQPGQLHSPPPASSAAHLFSTPAVADILGPHGLQHSQRAGPGNLGGVGSHGVPVVVRALAGGGREEGVLLEYLAKLEDAHGKGCHAPCGVLLRGVEVAVGSWQEEGEEAGRGRADGLLMRVAMKRVLSVVEAALREGGEPRGVAAVKVEGGVPAAAGAVKVKEEAPVKREMLHGESVEGAAFEPRLLQGARGATAAQDAVSRLFWERAGKGDAVDVPRAGGAGRRVLVVHAPALPPRSPQTKPKLAPPQGTAAPSPLPPSAAGRPGQLAAAAAAHVLPLSPPSLALGSAVTAAPWSMLSGVPQPAPQLHVPPHFHPGPPVHAPQPFRLQ